MVHPIRSLRTGPGALFLLSAALLALGAWGQIAAPSGSPAARMIAEVVTPMLQQAIPEALGRPVTIFGTFAKFAGLAALAGLLLAGLRPAAAPAPAPQSLPRVTPRRPGAPRIARPTEPAIPAPQPQPAAPPALAGLAARLLPRRRGAAHADAA